MFKKFNILLVLLLLFISITAVSAADGGNITELASNEAIQDNLEISVDEDVSDTSDSLDDVVAIEESELNLSSSTHTINKNNYDKYFNALTGELSYSDVESGDTFVLDGDFSGVNFVFNIPVNVVGSETNNMKNSMITLSGGASGSTVSGLNIINTKAETSGVLLNSAGNCVVRDCVIVNSGASSYPISVINGANYNNITGNNLKSYGVTYGHGTRSTPGLILSGSDYNYIANNYVEVDDANGIYLSSYSGGINKGGLSNFNMIYNNTVKCSDEILPTSWSYSIQIMGNNNTIKSNTVIRGYRGISTAGTGNIIDGNTIINITGADYNHIGVETGGEYGIVGAYYSTITNNKIIGAKIISTGAGISAIDNSVVENNWVNVTKVGRGINAGGSNVIVRNNTVYTVSGSGIYEKDEGSGLLVENNNVVSDSGVGILIEKLNSRRMPSNVTVISNTVKTGNDIAIDASGVVESTSNIDFKSNNVYGKLIKSPAGVIDTSKPIYVFNGNTIPITPLNIREYINVNGGLTSNVNDGDTLVFDGTFNDEVIYITKSIRITGKNPIFYNSTFKVTSGNVLIENLTIINREANRVNAWGIFTNQAQGVRIVNNKITVSDPKAAYAVYVLESTNVEVINNELISEGDYLTFTLLSYASEDCIFSNNNIKTTGTGEVYSFAPEKCIDGNEITVDGKQYCIDGNELFIDGKSYCIDGNELTVDGRSYCIDGNELCIDGEEYSMGEAHVISEIYQTYGILLLYSSNNVISGNDVNVTSKLDSVHATTGEDNSTNSLVGIDLYFNSHNNVFSSNNVHIKANDNYIYGMGVLGYNTGHTAPDGQGASNNIFDGNEITLEGPYFTTGMIVGSSCEETVLKDNVIDVKSPVGYGITLEMSQNSTIENNKLNLNSEAIYGIDLISSSGNVMCENTIVGEGKQVYGILISNGENNKVEDNLIKSIGTGESLSFKNLDSLGFGNAGIYLKANSINNSIRGNNVTSSKGYSILVDDSAISNDISSNYLQSEKGNANKAISNAENNEIADNYAYIVNPISVSADDVKYMGSGEFSITFGSEVDGAIVNFYDADGKLFAQSKITNGIAKANYKFDQTYPPAQYIFTAKLSGENFKSVESKFKFNILKGNAVINIPSVSIEQGDSGNIVAKVSDEFGNPIANTVVQFNRINSAGRANPLGSAKTDVNGVATLEYMADKSLNAGSYNITAVVNDMDDYNGGENVSTLTVVEKISITGAKAYSVYYGNTVSYKLRIITADTKQPVQGKEVTFKINGKTKTLASDKNGYVTYSVKLATGSYTIEASCDGYAVSKKITFKPTVIAKNLSKKKAKTIKYTAKVVNKNGKILKNKKVTFKIKNKKYSAKTNNKGIATISLKNYKVGKYSAVISYGGCSVKKTITIKK